MSSLPALTAPPPLREGDRLGSGEFLRRWEAMPDLKHAELIDGIVFMPSPVSYQHSSLHGRVTLWQSVYADRTPGTETLLDATWLLARNAVPQPDIALRILAECGGQSSVRGNYLSGAPELIVEISVSTTSRDLGIKLDLYQRSGVREYITVLSSDEQIVWRHLVRGRYREIQPGDGGLLRSRVFPGLWLDPAALWNRERSVIEAVEQGTGSPEHSAFVEKLAKRRARRKSR